MAIRMQRRDGMEATRQVASATRIVILTDDDPDESVFDALAAGASGFLLKAAPPEQLIHAIEVVAAGNALLDPSVTKRLIAEFARRPEPALRRPKELSTLTEREREVLLEIARGFTNAEIAGRLHVSVTTVKTHVAHVLAQMTFRHTHQP